MDDIGHDITDVLGEVFHALPRPGNLEVGISDFSKVMGERLVHPA